MAKSRNQKKSKETKFVISDYKLSQRDSVIFNLMQQYPELKQKQIAQMVGITESQFSVVVNKPAFKKALQDFSKSALEILQGAKVQASLKLRELIHHSNPRVALRACENILRQELTPVTMQYDKQEAPEFEDMTTKELEQWIKTHAS
jgi:predicted XRE-type DNA-binding protein